MAAIRAARDADSMGILDAVTATFDSWFNTKTGMGTSKDRMTHTHVGGPEMLAPQVLAALYDSDDFAATIVDALIDDALRDGWTTTRRASEDDADELDGDESKEQAARIDRRCVELGVLSKFREAARWGRLYGGGAIFTVVRDGRLPSQPLDLENVTKVVALTVMERSELTPGTYYRDPLAPKFGEVEVWRYQSSTGGGTLEIHESRLLRFEGAPVTKTQRRQENGWSLSVLTRVYQILRDAGVNWMSVSHILNDASVGVWSIKGLAEAIANGRRKQVQDRMEVANMAKSVGRAVLIDADGESFTYATRTIAGLGELLDKTWLRVAAAARMPLTRLMGMSPAGLNATGASDIRLWYDAVKSYRTDDIQPPLERVVQLLARETQVASPEEWTVKWPSLWQMTPPEEATHRKTIADTDSIYIDKGVVTAAEVTATRFGGGQYSDGPIVVDLALREANENAEATALERDAEAKRAAEAVKPKPDVSSDDTSNAPTPPTGGG